MTKSEIQAALDKAKRMLETGKKQGAPKNVIDMGHKQVEKYEKMLAEYKEEEEKKEEKKEEKEEKKKVETRGRKKGSTKQVLAKKEEPKKETKPSTKTVVIDGKTYTDKDAEFCDMLLKKFENRKTAQKKAAKKFKTKTISEKIGSNISNVVSQTVKHIVDANKTQTSKNPKELISKLERLETATTRYIDAIKLIFGSDLKSSEIKEELSEIHNVIKKVVTKLKSKK